MSYEKYGTAAVFLVVCLLLIGAAHSSHRGFYVNDAANILIDRHKDAMMAASSGWSSKVEHSWCFLPFPLWKSRGMTTLKPCPRCLYLLGNRRTKGRKRPVDCGGQIPCRLYRPGGKSLCRCDHPAQINEVCQTVVATMQRAMPPRP